MKAVLLLVAVHFLIMHQSKKNEQSHIIKEMKSIHSSTLLSSKQYSPQTIAPFYYYPGISELKGYAASNRDIK